MFPHPYANSRFRKIAGIQKVENKKNKVQHRKVKIKITFKNSKILKNYLKAFKIQSDVDFGMLMIFKKQLQATFRERNCKRSDCNTLHDTYHDTYHMIYSILDAFFSSSPFRPFESIEMINKSLFQICVLF